MRFIQWHLARFSFWPCGRAKKKKGIPRWGKGVCNQPGLISLLRDGRRAEWIWR
jgi:hypothetical protein